MMKNDQHIGNVTIFFCMTIERIAKGQRGHLGLFTIFKKNSGNFGWEFRSVRTVRVVYHMPKISGLSPRARLDSTYNMKLVQRGEGEGGGRCLQGNLWYSPPATVTSRLALVTFKMASEVFIEETDKNFDFITEILFRFLGFGDFEVSIIIEN